MRREPTAADTLGGLEEFPTASLVYERHVRLARTFEGEKFYLVPYRRAPTVYSRPEKAACRRRIVREARRIDPAAVSYARRRAAREGRQALLAPDAVEVLDDSRVVGQGHTARGLGSSGGWSASGREGGPSRVVLLLPDAVARVRSHHDGFVAEVATEANLAIFHVPPGHESEPELVQWFDPSGAMIREVRMRDETIGD